MLCFFALIIKSNSNKTFNLNTYIFILFPFINLDNTNNLKFELYAVLAKVDGIGLLLAYLFLENNGNCENSVRTDIIINFLLQLKICGLEPDFFITDKDFAQISAARFV